MLRHLFNLATKAIVLYSTVQGTQRQVRLTAAIAALDAAKNTPVEQPLHFDNYQPICTNDTAEVVAVQAKEIPQVDRLVKQLKAFYARTCWGLLAIVHAIFDILTLCHTQLFGRFRRHQHFIPVQ